MHKLPKVGTLLYIRNEDYEEMLEIFDDGDDLPPTWEEWMEGLEDIEQQVRAAGALSRRYLITPQSFTEYCRREGIPPDANARLKLKLSINNLDPTPEE